MMPRPISVTWHKDRFRCELWACGDDPVCGYQLKLFHGAELVRVEDVTLPLHAKLALSWKLELFETAAVGWS